MRVVSSNDSKFYGPDREERTLTTKKFPSTSQEARIKSTNEIRPFDSACMLCQRTFPAILDDHLPPTLEPVCADGSISRASTKIRLSTYIGISCKVYRRKRARSTYKQRLVRGSNEILQLVRTRKMSALWVTPSSD